MRQQALVTLQEQVITLEQVLSEERGEEVGVQTWGEEKEEYFALIEQAETQAAEVIA
jgi:hypothetical protein